MSAAEPWWRRSQTAKSWKIFEGVPDFSARARADEEVVLQRARAVREAARAEARGLDRMAVDAWNENDVAYFDIAEQARRARDRADDLTGVVDEASGPFRLRAAALIPRYYAGEEEPRVVPAERLPRELRFTNQNATMREALRGTRDLAWARRAHAIRAIAAGGAGYSTLAPSGTTAKHSTPAGAGSYAAT